MKETAGSGEAGRGAGGGSHGGDEASTALEQGRNEVILWGRVAAEPEERTLPSGDVMVSFRVVIPRRGTTRGRRRPAAESRRPATVDTIDIACWTAATRRVALRLVAGDAVEVEGSLRRRFFGGPTGRQSRYEVESAALRRLGGRARAAT